MGWRGRLTVGSLCRDGLCWVLKRLCVQYFCIVRIVLLSFLGGAGGKLEVISFFDLPCQISDENILLYFQAFDMNKR